MENLARIQLKLQATPEQAFQALLTSAALTQWFSEFAHVSSTAKAYDFWGRFTPETPNQQAGHHPLTQLEHNRHLAYTWRLNQADTHVLIKLLGRQEETILTLRHMAAAGAEPTQGYSLEDFWSLALENLRRHLDGKAVTARMDFSAPMVGDIRHELMVDAPAAEVFDTLIRPDQMNRWLANGAEVEPEPGGTYSFGWAATKILEIVPDKKLTVSMPADPDSGFGETVATWTLAENGGKTRLTFVHSGFAPDQSNAGMNVGWLAFTNYIASITEYGDGWQPPIVLVKPEMLSFYSTSTSQGQAEILDELRAPLDVDMATVG